ncbi:MAG: nicotinate phosphoribosyltransferase [Proteobacteria bacterium]|nr:nicotinate phosphoribosyltransferase [Pseudomonadota bacterium]
MTSTLHKLYGHSLALLTDLYQLTMAHGYWKSGVAERRAAFHLFFRKNPFKGGYALACGLQHAVEYVENFRFTRSDLDYLATLRGNDDGPLFESGFLDYLDQMGFSCDVDAMPEGTVAFAHEPLVRVRGPIIQGQLLETPLLNMINYSTLIATKAARICQATRGGPVLELGLRRAQGTDGGITASRAAYIGGCIGTSNVLAGKLFGIPVKGTHAHSWVMSFADERESFDVYAQAMPNNCIFLVDTYDTLEGVKNAIAVGDKLRRRGHEMVGIRLDSGDLAHFSIKARQLLDQAGFVDAKIVASNDLDEHIIDSLIGQGAAIGVWGVGTKLATAYDQPALGAVYKLAAVENNNGNNHAGWDYRIKLSEQPIKISNPGILQVRRLSQSGRFSADMIYCQDSGPESGVADPTGSTEIYDINDPTLIHKIVQHDDEVDLLVPIFRNGQRVYDLPDLETVRSHAGDQLSRLDGRIKRFSNPQIYPVGLGRTLHRRKQALIARARGQLKE